MSGAAYKSRPIFGVMDTPLLGALIIGALLGALFLIFQGKSDEYQCQNQPAQYQTQTTNSDTPANSAPTPTNGQEGSGQQAQQAQACQAETGFAYRALSFLRRTARLARRYSEFITAVFTGVLMLFTGFLWKSTNDLWVASNAQAADIKAQIEATEAFAAAATKSANIAEETQTVLERPYIYLADIYGIDKDRGVNIKVTNYGRTPAIVRHIRANFIVANKRQYPPYSREKGTTFNDFYVLGTGNSTEDITYTIKDHIALEAVSEDHLAPVVAEREFGYLVVTVTYDDVKGKEHEAGTCWRYYRKDESNYFIRHTDPKCHYQT